MSTPQSSPVVAGEQATADQYNKLRTDILDNVLGHDHSGTADSGKAPAQPTDEHQTYQGFSWDEAG